MSISALVVGMTISSCEKPIEQKEVPVESVTISPNPASVVAGETSQLEVKVLPEDATDTQVIWTSRDKTIATVDENGLVTGVKEGEVEVAATVGKVTARCKVSVTPAPIRVESVSLNVTESELFVGKMLILAASTTPEAVAYPEQTWTSSDEKVATVVDGKVLGVAEGTATITVTIDEKSASCTVKVVLPDAEITKIPTIEKSGSTVEVSAIGVLASDKVRLESIAGEAFAITLDILEITSEGFTFSLPSDLNKTRSYKLSILRNDEVKAQGYLRPNDKYAVMPFYFGYAMTGSNQGVPDDASYNIVRHGFLNGDICELCTLEDDSSMEWKVWKGDADLEPMTFNGGNMNFNDNEVRDIKTLSGLKGILDFSGVTANIFLQCSSLEELDLTMFPNVKRFYAWAAAFKKINFGKVGVDAPCYLDFINLNSCGNLTELDLRNCICLRDNDGGWSIRLSGCSSLSKIELGTATGDESIDKDQMMLIYGIDCSGCSSLRELNVSNCGRLRQLDLSGCKIERLDLRNNALGDGPTWPDGGAISPRPDSWFPYLYLLKHPDKIKVDWASAAEAKGERWLKVEHYWATTYSSGNTGETGAESETWPNGWVNSNPVAAAENAGIPISYWTYWNEDSNPVPHEVNK